MQIFAEIPWGGASNDSMAVDNGNFQFFSLAIFFGNFRDEASVIIWRYAVRRQLFSDPNVHDLEWLFRVEFCFHAGLAGYNRTTFEI